MPNYTQCPEPPPEAPASIAHMLLNHGAEPESRPAQPPSEAREALTPVSTVVCWTGDGLRP